MGDEFEQDYVPKRQPPRQLGEGRFPPRRKWPKTEEGQDFATLTAKHGRPFGPFEMHGRQRPYGVRK